MRWIDATKRKPKAYVNVILCLDGGLVAVGWWNQHSQGFYSDGDFEPVTHWMSLPKPPRKRGKRK